MGLLTASLQRGDPYGPSHYTGDAFESAYAGPYQWEKVPPSLIPRLLRGEERAWYPLFVHELDYFKFLSHFTSSIFGHKLAICNR